MANVSPMTPGIALRVIYDHRSPMELQECTVYWVFFFFQAEDGIRDLTVTGVQTCALPISTCSSRRALEEQVALVTGAGRGIGRAIAVALATEGAAVVLAARTRQQLAEVAAEIRERGGRALAVPTDVTQDTAVEALVEQTMAEVRRLDVVVTAAGTASVGAVAP